MPRQVCILLIDDHPAMGGALESWVKTEPGFVYLGQMLSPAEAAVSEIGIVPDVILMDYEIPGFDTPISIAETRLRHPKSKLLMLSAYCTGRHVRRSMGAGASGYICKHESPGDIANLIRRSVDGELVLSRAARLALSE